MSHFTPDDYLHLEFHPACKILPAMDDADYARLKEDLAAHGLRHPIVLHEGMILDGRNRFEACIDLGIVPTFTEWNGGTDIVDFVLGENLYRRHLTASQKAMVATAALDYHREAARARQEATHLQGRDSDNQPIRVGGSVSAPGALTEDAQTVAAESSVPVTMAVAEKGKAVAAAAKQVGVSPRTVEQAAYVKKHGTPDDADAVLTGKASVKAKAAEIRARTAPPAPKGSTAKDASAAQLQVAAALSELYRRDENMIFDPDGKALISNCLKAMDRYLDRFVPEIAEQDASRIKQALERLAERFEGQESGSHA